MKRRIIMTEQTGTPFGGSNPGDLPATPLSPAAQAIKDAFTNDLNTAIMKKYVVDPTGANIKLTFAPSLLTVHLEGPDWDVFLPYAVG
jgi:hypothetical protein